MAKIGVNTVKTQEKSEFFVRKGGFFPNSQYFIFETGKSQSRHLRSELLSSERKHIPALDGLRGLACLTVVIYHNFGYIQKYIFFGWVTVDLFFTLSSFLITDILLRALNKPNYLRNFYARRFFRIFPLYYLSLIIFLIILPQFSTPLRLEYYTDNQIYFWTYLQNWLFVFKPPVITDSLNHFWSLAVEEQFYLIWPLIILIIRKPRHLQIAVSALLVIVNGLRLWAWLQYVPGFSYYNLYTFTRIDGICIGSMVALLRIISPGFLSRYTAGVVLFFAALNFGFFFINREFDFSFPYLALVGYSTLAMLLGLLLNQAITGETKIINSIFNFSFFRFVGKISYGFYIFHWPLYRGLGPALHSKALNYMGETTAAIFTSATASLLALLLSWISFKYFESPFLKLKDRFS